MLGTQARFTVGFVAACRRAQKCECPLHWSADAVIYVGSSQLDASIPYMHALHTCMPSISTYEVSEVTACRHLRMHLPHMHTIHTYYTYFGSNILCFHAFHTHVLCRTHTHIYIRTCISNACHQREYIYITFYSLCDAVTIFQEWHTRGSNIHALFISV